MGVKRRFRPRRSGQKNVKKCPDWTGHNFLTRKWLERTFSWYDSISGSIPWKRVRVLVFVVFTICSVISLTRNLKVDSTSDWVFFQRLKCGNEDVSHWWRRWWCLVMLGGGVVCVCGSIWKLYAPRRAHNYFVVSIAPPFSLSLGGGVG